MDSDKGALNAGLIQADGISCVLVADLKLSKIPDFPIGVLVAIRITKTMEKNLTVLRVDGRLASEDLEELTREFRSVQGATSLDLSDLQTADRPAVQLLKELIALGTELRGASPYIELLLKSNS